MGLDSTKENAMSIVGEFAEVGLDSLLVEGVCKDIPGVNIAVSAWKGFKGIREYNFLKKLSAFLDNFYDCSDEYKEELRQLLNEEDGEEKLGEKVVFLLDSSDGKAKARLIGKCLRAYKDEKITRDELFCFWHAVDRCFVDDIKMLPEFKERKQANDPAWRLANTGLIMLIPVLDGGLQAALNDSGKRFLDMIALEY